MGEKRSGKRRGKRNLKKKNLGTNHRTVAQQKKELNIAKPKKQWPPESRLGFEIVAGVGWAAQKKITRRPRRKQQNEARIESIFKKKSLAKENLGIPLKMAN